MSTEISQIVSVAWGNWKRCSAVLCDEKMPVKLKGGGVLENCGQTISRVAETWATTRGQEARLEVN